MDFFVYRNSTLENILGNAGFRYSGYDDLIQDDITSGTIIWFYILSVDKSPGESIREIDSFSDKLRLILDRVRSDQFIFAFTLYDFYPLLFELKEKTIRQRIQKFNDELFQMTFEYKNLKVIELADFARDYSVSQLVDWKYFFTSGIIINPRLAPVFRSWFLKQVDYIQFKRKKCLVLDLDNTIWGGILGEAGELGIALAGSYPGNVYSMFQKQLLELYRCGVILAVCSKNNEEDVFQFWRTNPDMILKMEYISVFKINWKNKVENIRQISEELNIGLDSFVFVDDQPVERELVKSFLPEVTVPDFPQQPYQIPVFFSKLLVDYFTTYELTSEDTFKTEQYKENVQRQSERIKFSSLTDYLRSLKIEMKVIEASDFNIARIAQMTLKTNQFNLTTKRYTEADIRGFMLAGDWVLCIEVADKFGNSGISGLAIVRFTGERDAEMDTFLLSCRILGKEIEFVFLNYLINLLKRKEIAFLTATYIKTLKNGQTFDFYGKAGFDVVDERENVRKFKLSIGDYNMQDIDYVKVVKS